MVKYREGEPSIVVGYDTVDLGLRRGEKKEGIMTFEHNQLGCSCIAVHPAIKVVVVFVVGSME